MPIKKMFFLNKVESLHCYASNSNVKMRILDVLQYNMIQNGSCVPPCGC